MGSAEALGGLVQDGFHHPVGIFENVAVPETQYRPTILDQELRPQVIIGSGIQMLGTVEFHCELS
ncbi:hypothetical protein GGQ82_000855 [Sphingobium olei]